MIVAVVAVGMMKVASHQIIRVPAVRHCLMPTAWAVLVARVMLAASVSGGAFVRIRGRDRELVIVHVVAVHMVQVPIVQVIRVSVVLHRGVSASCLVFVGVPRVGLTSGAHRRLSFVLG